MAHSAAGGGGESGNKADDGLLNVLLDKSGRRFFVGSADFANHDDRVGVAIAVEEGQHVDEIHGADRVAANADAGGLADSPRGALPDGFVGERAGAGDDADFFTGFAFARGGVDVAGHNADFAFARSDDAGAVGADQDAFGFVAEEGFNLHHVQNGNAFGDGHDDFDAGVSRFHDGIARERGGDENHGGNCAGFVHGLLNRIENRQAIGVFLAAFSGGDAADHFGAVFEAAFGVKSPGRSGDALADHLGAFVDEDAHGRGKGI